jgi:AraC-like DNA-binding protein
MESYYTWAIVSPQQWTEAEHIRPTYPVKNAAQQSWVSAIGSIHEQTFDGRYAYLYYYEFDLIAPISISITRKKGDLHLLYPLQNEGMSWSYQCKSGDISLVLEQESFYIYTPKGHYDLQVPTGRHILIGFIIDAGLIRSPASRAYTFVVPLVEAKRGKAKAPMQSASFPIGPLTRRALKNIYGLLNPKELTNEYELLRFVIYLIQLSRFKLLLAAEKEQLNQPKELIRHARELLEVNIQTFGARALLSDIAELLKVPVGTLSRAHKQYYHTSFLKYRNELLVKHVIKTIKAHDRMIEAAINSGFAGIPEMNRFLKGQTGQSSRFFK